MEKLYILAIFQVKLLRWHSGKESTCQSRGCRFAPWVRKIPWRRKWQPTPVLLPGESHGGRSLVGYYSIGLQRVGHDGATSLSSLSFTYRMDGQGPNVQHRALYSISWDKP